MSVDSHTRDKKISVVIPVYNGARYIAEAIHSAAEQTLPPQEIIVVNDGSTDESASILAKLGENIPFRYYFRENAGQSAARNFGIQQSQGDLIAFLDQDDMWYPNHLEELVKPFLEKSYPEIGWAYSTVDDIGENGELYRLDLLAHFDARHPKRSLAQCLATEMFVIPSATLVLKKALDDVGGFDERLAGYEDDDLFVRIFARGYGNVFINKSLGQWRLHGESCSWDSQMAVSRKLYARKLLDAYTDDYVRNVRYRTDVILPRFRHIYFAEIKRAVLFQNHDYARLMRQNLAELYPYMTWAQKIKSQLIVFLLMKMPGTSLLQLLTDMYWRFTRVADH